MIEIYLFIHPLCSESLASEKRILQMIQTEHKKVQFKFLPLLNLQSFQQYLQDHHLEAIGIHERNRLFEASYSAALDYKAMQLQGKKKGRAFLLKLQEKICIQNASYSDSLVDGIVTKIGGDLSMFRADRSSAIVHDSFISDQETAKEMKVCKNTSAVVFNYACDRDFGVLIEEEPTSEILHELFKTNEKTCFDTYVETGQIKPPKLNDYCLRLIEN
ncbi:DsbA family protein [uncultured Vagococcus sp.]|uniref:DsbA family protein n=1 Tax=uncultured Vagococcus sp. TaxID=189676 RepID=UPI0028D77735|nr:DsbA family protein [uncultured Vagococcus sp.]